MHPICFQYVREAATRFALRVEGYSLTKNHIRLSVTPEREDSQAGALKRPDPLDTQYVNRQHVWENRFLFCLLDSDHRGRALVYVERNPVRASLCREVWQ